MSSYDFSVAELRRCLAGTCLPTDPTRAMPPSDLDKWPEDWLRAISRPLKPAGVLIPIIERAPHLTVLLTRRSAELKHHASQISFPGGRMERTDSDILETALRETHEEVGILASAVTVIGNLEPQPTLTGYAVTPIIGLIEPPVKLAIDRREVEVAFEVPLSFLMDPDNVQHSVRKVRAYTVPTTEFHFGGHRIWGATANMLVMLRETLTD